MKDVIKLCKKYFARIILSSQHLEWSKKHYPGFDFAVNARRF